MRLTSRSTVGSGSAACTRRATPLVLPAPACAPAATCSTSGSSALAAAPSWRRGPSRSSVRPFAAAAEPTSITDDLEVSAAAGNSIQYAIELARTSETYEVHSWMLLLGLLRQENSTACKALRQLGLEDLYSAWHEVLWALNACDGLKPRAYAAQIGFQERAFRIIRGSMNFAAWRGHNKVQSEDLLMALAAGGVLQGLFPDLNLTLPKVRKTVEKITGWTYQLPDDQPKEAGALSSSEDFL